MITVLAAGAFNTVQDLGRVGARRFGVSTSGAMDPVALRAGNALLGNADGAAAVEIQSFPFQARFERTTAFALTGADCGATLDARPVPPWWCGRAEAGEVLLVDFPRRGSRAYLAVAGGIDLPPVLNSRSTHLRAGFGGHDGRPLRAGDVLPVKACTRPGDRAGYGAVPPDVVLGSALDGDGALAIRVLRAGEHDVFPADARSTFWSTRWRIGVQSDRTGYRLGGGTLALAAPLEMRSYGVMPGLIQVPPAGEPIIQLSDANTVGGYPKIAAVIEADLWRLGQARPGSFLRFVDVDHRAAVAAALPVAAYLDGVRRTAALHSARPSRPDPTGAPT